LQRTLASVLATLVFWTPFSLTVARAQDREEQLRPAEFISSRMLEEGVAQGFVGDDDEVDASKPGKVADHRLKVEAERLARALARRHSPR